MKTDEFEEQLKQQPFRKVPEGWRKEILGKAQAAQPVSRSQGNPIWRWWRELLWPCPQAWAALGAAWVVMLAINVHVGGAEHPTVAKVKATQISPEVLMALQQQRQLQIELSGPTETTAESERARPRPRTQRELEHLRA